MAGFHDIQNQIAILWGAAPAVITDNTAMASPIIDMRDYEEVVFVAVTGTLADVDATYTWSLAHGDAVDSESAPASITDTAAVPDESLDPLEAAASFTYALDNGVSTIAYKPRKGTGKRWVKATLTPGGNTGNAPLAMIVLGKKWSVGS